MNKERIRYLFYRHFSNSSSEAEKEELSFYMHHPSYQEDILSMMEEAWKSYSQEQPHFSDEKSKHLLANILNHPMEPLYEDEEEDIPLPPLSTPLWKRLSSIAAILVMLCGIGIWYWQTASPTQESNLSMASTSPTIYKATLAFPNGEAVDLNALAMHSTLEVESIRILKADSNRIAYQASASPQVAHSIHTITTPKGGQFAVTLPDGTLVWLNTASSISYPAQFSSTLREVHITGEAYFEVAKSATVPFRVEANGTEIEVLGTQFNINAYENESAVRTTLVEGSIKVHHSKATKLLHPGEEAFSQSNQITIKEADLECTLGWKNGVFQFDQTPLTEVMKQLSNWYDVEVKYEGKVPNRSFSGEIPRTYTLPQVLEILQISQIQLNQNEKTIVIQP